MANLSTPLLSLSTAATWGAGDFCGGIATRRSTVFSVVAVAHGAGLLFMLALAVLFRERMPGEAALAWALAAGITGGAGLACLYRALAVGKMGLNAPLSSVITALVPLIFSLFREGLPHLWRTVGLAVALVSIWLIASQNDSDHPSDKLHAPIATTSPADTNQGVALAIAAGLGFGGFLVLIKFAGSCAVFWPLAMTRVGSLGLMLTMLAVSRGEWRLAPGSLRWVLLAGFLDTGANALYVAATQRGSLAVAAVLSSLYPGSTVILARIALKERWSRLQGVGMATALVAVGLISY
ncbi:MAG TPA: DMT family transporter [Terriglobales bacterium]|nr:DMT family transporter [Terriglobales bacterium]